MTHHPVDIHVGQRIRHRRWLMQMTQQQLAEALGMSFQQVQKYENGKNRVSASRLLEIAKALHVPVAYFFEGVDADLPEKAPELARPEDIKLASRINELAGRYPERHAAVVALIGSMTREEMEAAA